MDLVCLGKLECSFINYFILGKRGFPRWLVLKNLATSAGDVREARWIPGSGRSPGRENRQPILVFLPGEFHGQRSLAGYRPQNRTVSDTTEET